MITQKNRQLPTMWKSPAIIFNHSNACPKKLYVSSDFRSVSKYNPMLLEYMGIPVEEKLPSNDDGNELPFWKQKSLRELSVDEWESLCDGCGKCCLHKLEDEDTAEIFYTEVACSLLDIGKCRCTNYHNRTLLIHDCVKLTAANLCNIPWLPATCAYRLIDEGKDLYWWHPLVSGDPETVHQAGISVRNRAIDEPKAENLENHIVSWPNDDSETD